MSPFSKSFLILALGLVTVISVAGVADARWGGPRGGCYGYGLGYGPGSEPGSEKNAAQAFSPEARQIWQSAQDKLAPLILELRAKHYEFTAKVYSGADNKVTETLSKDILRLQAQVTEARLALQQQLAAAGVPLRAATGGCVMGRGMMGGGGMSRGQKSCPMWQ